MVVRILASLRVDPAQREAAEAYLTAAVPIIAAAGGKVLQEYQIDRTIVGQADSDSLLIVEYPDMAAVDSVFGSDAYQAIVPLRDKGFSAYSLSILT